MSAWSSGVSPWSGGVSAWSWGVCLVLGGGESAWSQGGLPGPRGVSLVRVGGTFHINPKIGYYTWHKFYKPKQLYSQVVHYILLVLVWLDHNVSLTTANRTVNNKQRTHVSQFNILLFLHNKQTLKWEAFMFRNIETTQESLKYT